MKNYFLTITINLIVICNIYSQSDIISDSTGLEEIVISASKDAQSKRNVPFQIETIDARQISFQNGQTMSNVLENSGAVVVQRSQQGGGSPMIRGFEASRILLVMDGVRMNNLIYRSGHLQNIMTIDPSILDRAEVLYGPSSTVYGSDALGGTIHMVTKRPKLNLVTEGVKIDLNASIRYGSINQEKTSHVNVNFGTKRFASLTGLTYSDFGNLKMGQNTQALDTLWGLRKFYQASLNGRDTMLSNEDKFLQKFSGYKQYDIIQKLLFQQNNNVSHLLNFQFSTSSDLPRYDRLTDFNANKNRFNQAEWYYGPQRRFLGSYVLSIENDGFFDKIASNLSFQNIEESRHTRGWQSQNLTSRIEDVNVFGANIDLLKKYKGQDVHVGADIQYSTVKSSAFTTNKTTGEIGSASTRYPDGDNNQTSAGIYLTHTWRINDKWILNDGFRIQKINLKSTFISQQFFKFPFTEIKQDNVGWSGNLGVVYHASKSVRFSSVVSTGFRSPNIDDLSKIFDTNISSNLVVVPNPDLRPEKTFNVDFGVNIRINDKMTWENTFFYTRMFDAIVVSDFRFNGQDSIIYDGVKSKVRAPQNEDEAAIIGYSSQISLDFLYNFTAKASINFTKGNILNNDDNDDNLDHVPPTYGRIGMAYEKSKFQGEINSIINGWKRIEDYRIGAEDNEQYATMAGMPSWWTLNIKAGYQISKNFTIQAGVENLMDIQYRVFASGIHAAGRNFYGTLRASF